MEKPEHLYVGDTINFKGKGVIVCGHVVGFDHSAFPAKIVMERVDLRERKKHSSILFFKNIELKEFIEIRCSEPAKCLLTENLQLKLKDG